ncbi:hypothetical protein PENSPDRAFT_751521 [Peniophora sp. CONT]|nr:hypothetical protein PENSPDRAFT_751521 [Peniophora sp. CONT]
MSGLESDPETCSRPLPPWTNDVDVVSDEGSDSPEISQEENKSGGLVRLDVDQEIVELVTSDPLEAANRWRILYRDRIRCGTNRKLWAFTRAIGSVARSAIIRDQTEDIRHKQRSFRRLVSQYELCAFLEDIVSQDDFFDEYPDFVLSVLETIFSVISVTKRQQKTLEPLRSLIAALCESSWNSQKSLVKDPDLERFYLGCREGVRDQIYNIMLALIMPSARSYGSDRAIRRISILCWFHSPDLETTEEDLKLSVILLDHAIRGCLSDTADEDDDEDTVSHTPVNFMESDIVSAFGAIPYLKRLTRTLEHPDLSDDALNWAVTSACSSVAHPELLAGLAPSGVLVALVEVVRRKALEGKPGTLNMPLANLVGMYSLILRIGAAAPGVQSAIPAVIRQGSLVEMIALSLRLCVVEGQSHNLSYDLCADGLNALQSRTVIIDRLSANNPLKKTMRQGFREHWYPTLAFLRQTRTYSTSVPEHNGISETWKRLGEELGFEEMKQKAQYERELRKGLRRCSRKDCSYHKDDSLTSLRICKGCADVRYCSVSCQRSDWKGGHKLKCRRLADRVPTDAT